MMEVGVGEDYILQSVCVVIAFLFPFTMRSIDKNKSTKVHQNHGKKQDFAIFCVGGDVLGIYVDADTDFKTTKQPCHSLDGGRQRVEGDLAFALITGELIQN